MPEAGTKNIMKSAIHRFYGIRIQEVSMDKIGLTEKCIAEQTVYSGKFISVHQDTVELPNGKTSIREIVRHPGAVAIVPEHEGKILMVRQYRYALAKETLEIPAGKMDPGEDPETCALRELREETGYEGELNYLGSFYTSPGFTDEIIHIYRAQHLSWSPLDCDEDEFLNVVAVPREQALQMAGSSGFFDAKTAIGLLLAL